MSRKYYDDSTTINKRNTIVYIAFVAWARNTEAEQRIAYGFMMNLVQVER